MNPARSFAPDLVIGDFGHFWVYLVGPLAGALIAVAFAWILRGPGGDPGGLAAARGMLSPADLDAAHTSSDAEPRPPS
jgi:aquaporin Z